MSIIAQITQQIIAGDQLVYISLFDSVTGQPVNGNNVYISYTQTINGVTTSHVAYIPGSAALIYKTTIPISTNSWQILTEPSSPDDPPPVSRCDLEINYITINQPESFPAAADAQITVNASSSYLPIRYSIDNINFQTSPTFTGLLGGLYTIYCTDANTLGCQASNTVTIPVTQNLLTGDPSVILTGNNISRWNAAFNPIVFIYQRKDFEVTAVSFDSQTGNAKVTINGDMSAVSTAYANNIATIQNAAAQGITLLTSQNIYIYLNAAPYVGVFTVTGADSNSITINTPYTTSAVGFVNINMLKPYYKILTNITYVDPLTNVVSTITSTNRPNSQGIVKADISNFLQSLCS